MATDLISDLLVGSNAWMVWLTIMTAIIGFVLIKMWEKKKQPEEKPFWGVEVRQAVLGDTMKERTSTWGKVINASFYQGFQKIGKILSIKSTIKTNPHPVEILEIKFVRSSFTAQLKAYIMGKFNYMIIHDTDIKKDDESKTIKLNQDINLIKSGGIWIKATKDIYKHLEDLAVSTELDNVKGFTSDFLRRLSTQRPEQAMFTDRIETQATLIEQAKKNRITGWGKGN